MNTFLRFCALAVLPAALIACGGGDDDGDATSTVTTAGTSTVSATGSPASATSAPGTATTALTSNATTAATPAGTAAASPTGDATAAPDPYGWPQEELCGFITAEEAESAVGAAVAGPIALGNDDFPVCLWQGENGFDVMLLEFPPLRAGLGGLENDELFEGLKEYLSSNGATFENVPSVSPHALQLTERLNTTPAGSVYMVGEGAVFAVVPGVAVDGVDLPAATLAFAEALGDELR